MNTLKFAYVFVVVLAVSLFPACEKSQESNTPDKVQEVALTGEEARHLDDLFARIHNENKDEN